MSLAADFEFDGGFIYTTFDSDNLNDVTEVTNNIYQALVNYIEDDPDYVLNDFDKMDDLDKATGYWIGFRSDYFKNELGLDYEIGVRYETFSNDVEANLHTTNQNTSDSIKINTSLEVEVKGFAVNGERKINDYIGITGTIGYYYGEISYLTDGEETLEGETIDTEEGFSNDLEGGAGFKVGISTDFPISDNLDVIGNANYRILELDIEDSNESIDFDGWELKGGLSYKF
ncbi:MAG: hypothetical protein ABR547_08135 [Halanaerobium sp.]